MKKKFWISGVCAALFILLTVLVKTADVAAVGPEGTSVGLSHLNAGVHRLFGENMFLYNITDWLGYIAIACGCVFALIGLLQFIKRKSILKVDKEILAAGGLYVAVAVLYALFEKVIVNYRPVVMPGETMPEASFPSSHTMLVIVIMGSVIMMLGRYVKNSGLASLLQIICAAILGFTVVGRLISGVHWFTDIIGGILISIALLALYSGAIDMLNEKKKNI